MVVCQNCGFKSCRCSEPSNLGSGGESIYDSSDESVYSDSDESVYSDSSDEDYVPSQSDSSDED